ncbi:hypothetical protein POX_c04091 [Penicillium oxalicum]|nr:hypothetical protein POX_c04091 [Penicillium oxalicum]KAI2791234.1 hypothetical protein POX_c04091 [Penicillium oxalicum]
MRKTRSMMMFLCAHGSLILPWLISDPFAQTCFLGWKSLVKGKASSPLVWRRPVAGLGGTSLKVGDAALGLARSSPLLSSSAL